MLLAAPPLAKADAGKPLSSTDAAAVRAGVRAQFVQAGSGWRIGGCQVIADDGRST